MASSPRWSTRLQSSAAHRVKVLECQTPKLIGFLSVVKDLRTMHDLIKQHKSCDTISVSFSQYTSNKDLSALHRCDAGCWDGCAGAFKSGRKQREIEDNCLRMTT